MDKIARQLSSGVQIARGFEQRYGAHALLRERQALLKSFEPPHYLQSMTQLQRALRTAFTNPFEEMMLSIRPNLDDLRLRADLDPYTLTSIQRAAEILARPSDIMGQIRAFEPLGYSSIGKLMERQSRMAEAAMPIRDRRAAVELPDLFPHDRVAQALAGIQVLSEESDVFRLSAKAALTSIEDYQAFAERQLRRAVSDHPIVFSRRMAVTDLAGDLLDTTQGSWELLGSQAIAVPDDQPPEGSPPTIYPHLNRELSYLYRKDVQADSGAAFSRSTASAIATLGGEIVELIYSINESRSSSGKAYIIKPTNGSLRAVHRITGSLSSDEQSFGEVVDALYFLIYEGSGAAKRLTDLMTDEELITVWWIKALRTSLRHDIDHGDKGKARRKHLEIGGIYSFLVGKRRPNRQADWRTAQVALYECTADFLRRVLDIVDPIQDEG